MNTTVYSSLDEALKALVKNEARYWNGKDAIPTYYNALYYNGGLIAGQRLSIDYGRDDNGEDQIEEFGPDVDRLKTFLLNMPVGGEVYQLDCDEDDPEWGTLVLIKFGEDNYEVFDY